ncbi:uncharacterized protein Bfra_010321 [Botrytis fragariae]|uniref:Uncharacterized protein n=1 Tax=Botrytis fragariae TaxID=1964551 RepID=A0A8H6AMX8_9HELO|nr:uncharacterized protein Bfra_010321 [Botrytis fragariae]KAF5870175.1 hypothetical protein Bfra_010321 [Botrytis fragariae]
MQSQSSSTTAIMVYPPRPGSQSPTLTEPDMILPLHNETNYDSEPSSRHTSFQFTSSSGDSWQRSNNSDYVGGPPPRTPTTPIIYGNGTMLSDIGEVTEVESTPGKKLPGPAERRFIKQQQLQNGHRISSTSLGHDLRRSGTKTGTHERKISVESASTVTSEPQSAMFGDIDDTVSVDDSNFQGDDEESVAESYTDPYRKELVEQETRRLSRREGNFGEGEDDQNSSAALSRRAEQILLNAKRRLNNMEGNLTRARSSLIVTPSISMPSIYSSSPLTNPSLLKVDRRISGIPSRQRSFSNFHTDSTASSPGHSRVWSENNISPSRATAFPVRASSAAATYRARSSMGSHTPKPASPLSPGMIKEESNEHGRPRGSGQSSPHSRISPSQPSHLEPLVEDGVPEFDGRTNGRTDTDREYSTAREGLLSRSSSTSSIRMQDIQHQMSDLKGRLSALRDRARDDNMKRRSLQSLRTPSPFTAGEQWYSGGVNGQDVVPKTDSVVDHVQSNGIQNGDPTKNGYTAQPTQVSARHAPTYAESDATSIYEDVDEGQVKPPGFPTHQNQTQVVEEEGYDTCSEVSEVSSNDSYSDDRSEFDEFDNEDNSDASIYHESVTEQVSHEDREDAFDYEHFFLYSAMGTMSRERRGSISSEDSVETTRGPSVPMPLVENGHDPSQRSSMVHLRSDSNSSISTLATFATAKSNVEDDEYSEDEDPFDLTIPITDTRKIDAPDSPTISPYKPTTTTSLATKRSTFGSLPPRNTVINDYNDIGIARGSGLYDIDVIPGVHSRNLSLDSATSASTTRSVPLSVKPRGQPSVFTPPGTASSTNSHPVRSDSLENNRNRTRTSPVQMLSKDDQLLVERLVASLGKCVLELQDTEAGNYDSRIWRRRLDAARRVLDGEEGAI